MDALLQYHREHSKTSDGQGSLFGKASSKPSLKLQDTAPISMEQKLAWEKDLLGLYVSGHPLDKHKERFADPKKTIRHAKEHLRGVETVIGGLIEGTSFKPTKNGERMAFFKISDFTDSIEVVVFPRVLKENITLLSEGTCVALKGRISERNGEASFVADKVKSLDIKPNS